MFAREWRLGGSSWTALTTLVAAAILMTAPPAGAGLAQVVAEPVRGGLGVPVDLDDLGDGRLFVTLLDGRVMILEGGELLLRPFLDLSSLVAGDGLGLWSVAFHPGYDESGWVFAHYAERETGDSIVARYRVSNDPDVVPASSEAILLRTPKPEQLHYGGQLAFGPDGMLYVSTGDGTGLETVDPECLAQSLTSLEGKLLRLDVENGADVAPYYTVPGDNPFVGQGRGEIWALGLRNPWRFSFDRLTGDLWLTDVGHDRREEIDFAAAGSPGGQNYGWKVMEGNSCLDQRAGCPASLPPCGDVAYTPPIHDYDHAGGRCSVIGGFVYRGALAPSLAGRYVYGDFCTGELWAAAPTTAGLEVEALAFALPGLAAFAEDAAGELWAIAGDTLYRLLEPGVEPGGCVAGDEALCLTGDRFEVTITWRTAAGATGTGQAVPLSGDSGMFWFFAPSNPEVFVKVLDACVDPFQRFWVFAAGLTDVETSLVVRDTKTGETRRYDRQLGQDYDPVRDTQAFATCP